MVVKINVQKMEESVGVEPTENEVKVQKEENTFGENVACLVVSMVAFVAVVALFAATWPIWLVWAIWKLMK